VLLLTPVIKLIPNAALAGVLCVVGYRLASPRRFRQCRKIGREQLFVFVMTIIATLLTDLLMGVMIGMITEYAVAWFFGAPALALILSVGSPKQAQDGGVYIELPAACTFGNVIGFKKAIRAASSLPLTLNFSHSVYVDHTFMQELRRVQRERDVIVIGLERLIPMSPHRESMRRVPPENLKSLAVKG